MVMAAAIELGTDGVRLGRPQPLFRLSHYCCLNSYLPAQPGRATLPRLRAGSWQFGERDDGGGPELGGRAGEMIA